MTSEKKYLVGYAGKAQAAVYSKRAWSSNVDKHGGCEKMTFLQAKKQLKTLMSENAEVAIFELKPVFKIKRKDLN